MLRIALLLCVSCGLLIAADNDTTAGYRNGRFWKSLPEHGKFGYLVGMEEGFTLSVFLSHETYTPATEKVLKWLPMKMTYDELIKMLDNFYAEPENARIGILAAVRMAKLRAQGLSQAGFQKEVEELRKAAAADPGPVKQ